MKTKADEIINIMVRCAKPYGYLGVFEEETLDTWNSRKIGMYGAPYYDGMVAVMFGSILLAQIGSNSQLKGISNQNIIDKLVNREKDRLEFAVDDDQGNHVIFIRCSESRKKNIQCI